VIVAVAAHWLVRSFLFCLLMSAVAGSSVVIIAGALGPGPIEPLPGVAIFFGGIYSVGISAMAGAIIRLARPRRYAEKTLPSIR